MLEIVDLYDARYVQRAAGTLRAFNEAGVLAAADVHVALRLAQLATEEDENTLLATALAVRAPRLGSVCVDLATIGATAATDLDDAGRSRKRCHGRNPRPGSTASPRAR